MYDFCDIWEGGADLRDCEKARLLLLWGGDMACDYYPDLCETATELLCWVLEVGSSLDFCMKGDPLEKSSSSWLEKSSSSWSTWSK